MLSFPPASEIKVIKSVLPEPFDGGMYMDPLFDEHLLGVIREQGEWPLRPKGARSMA